MFVLIRKELVTIFSEGFFKFSIRNVIVPGLDSANCRAFVKLIDFSVMSDSQATVDASRPDKP